MSTRDKPDRLPHDRCTTVCRRHRSPAVAATLEEVAVSHIRALMDVSRNAFACGDTDLSIRLLRRAVAEAIQHGDATLAVECYLALAARLDSIGALAAAVAELREVEDLCHGSSPPNLWRVYAKLAHLYESEGAGQQALLMAHHALAWARRAADSDGSREAETLVRRLYHRRRDTSRRNSTS